MMLRVFMAASMSSVLSDNSRGGIISRSFLRLIQRVLTPMLFKTSIIR